MWRQLKLIGNKLIICYCFRYEIKISKTYCNTNLKEDRYLEMYNMPQKIKPTVSLVQASLDGQAVLISCIFEDGNNFLDILLID